MRPVLSSRFLASASLVVAGVLLPGCGSWVEGVTAGSPTVVDPENYALEFASCTNPGPGEVLRYELTIANQTTVEKVWDVHVEMVDEAGTTREFASMITRPLQPGESDTISPFSGNSDLTGAVECSAVVMEDPLLN